MQFGKSCTSWQRTTSSGEVLWPRRSSVKNIHREIHRIYVWLGTVVRSARKKQFQRVENWITVVQIEALAKLIDCFAYNQQRVIWLAVTCQKQALFEITIDF
ncbi:unnamed protein product [Didymodactylos carnosus]|uniref:Uncharacterized protein n=1 Tax=Didymodactylos carnosus TaxID=1234261 RepID=A0A814P404_9BILA|nr:unnamed protein product [Didymodactylos carnosus]CAF1214354.1 unnamed protein product [Didymodactylos carnosus]CAF3864675.1 unnamed protein product [Didymodactylos carnosus]CAF4023016.1 unnamed protein product [Didymodactylos carnosus]